VAQPLVLGAWLIPRNTPLPTCYPVLFVRCRSNATSIIKEICLKYFDPSLPIFQGHSRSLELMRIDSPPGPLSYRFQVKRHFQSKIANFPTLGVFDTPTEEVSLGIGYWRIHRRMWSNTRMMGYQVEK